MKDKRCSKCEEIKPMVKDKLLLWILAQLERILARLENSQTIKGSNRYKTNLSVKQFRNGEIILERNLGGGNTK